MMAMQMVNIYCVLTLLHDKKFMYFIKFSSIVRCLSSLTQQCYYPHFADEETEA